MFVPSSYAHGKIKSLDITRALRMPGIVTILTGKSLLDTIDPLPANARASKKDWHWRIPTVFPLAVDKVRFIGEPVAAIIAEDLYQASDAIDSIKVDYEPLPVVVDPLKLWHRIRHCSTMNGAATCKFT